MIFSAFLKLETLKQKSSKFNQQLVKEIYIYILRAFIDELSWYRDPDRHIFNTFIEIVVYNYELVKKIQNSGCAASESAH